MRSWKMRHFAELIFAVDRKMALFWVVFSIIWNYFWQKLALLAALFCFGGWENKKLKAKMFLALLPNYFLRIGAKSAKINSAWINSAKINGLKQNFRDFGKFSERNTVVSPISGHLWCTIFCPLIRGVRYLESRYFLPIFGLKKIPWNTLSY